MTHDAFRDTAAQAPATADSPPACFARATVHAGATTTSYCRAGSGDTVLLLGDSFSDSDPPRDPLVDALAHAHRVVVPDLACRRATNGTRPPAFSEWLRGFLDGLGATHTSIVSRDAYAVAALAFALTDADRVARLVLLFGDVPDPLDPGDALAEQLEGARCRLLVVRESPEPRPPHERESQWRAIEDFLRRS
jgi:pimeloyl-ACP methyl ester carboxylesterase